MLLECSKKSIFQCHIQNGTHLKTNAVHDDMMTWWVWIALCSPLQISCTKNPNHLKTLRATLPLPSSTHQHIDEFHFKAVASLSRGQVTVRKKRLQQNSPCIPHRGKSLHRKEMPIAALQFGHEQMGDTKHVVLNSCTDRRKHQCIQCQAALQRSARPVFYSTLLFFQDLSSQFHCTVSIEQMADDWYCWSRVIR